MNCSKNVDFLLGFLACHAQKRAKNCEKISILPSLFSFSLSSFKLWKLFCFSFWNHRNWIVFLFFLVRSVFGYLEVTTVSFRQCNHRGRLSLFTFLPPTTNIEQRPLGKASSTTLSHWRNVNVIGVSGLCIHCCHQYRSSTQLEMLMASFRPDLRNDSSGIRIRSWKRSAGSSCIVEISSFQLYNHPKTKDNQYTDQDKSHFAWSTPCTRTKLMSHFPFSDGL